MVQNLTHTINEEQFLLHHSKCLFWENEKTLILSDIHLGKASHFRKNGIGVSIDIIGAELDNLATCISTFNPKKIVIVGDLFHSYLNNEVEIFGKWIAKFQHIEWHLIKGNHDIMGDEIYQHLGLTHHLQLQIKKIVFTHELPKKAELYLYYITGHIHPAVKVAIGKTKQKTLPCFFFGQQHAILPSFGLFTGNYTIKPLKKDSVYAITPTSIIEI